MIDDIDLPSPLVFSSKFSCFFPKIVGMVNKCHSLHILLSKVLDGAMQIKLVVLVLGPLRVPITSFVNKKSNKPQLLLHSTKREKGGKLPFSQMCSGVGAPSPELPPPTLAKDPARRRYRRSNDWRSQP
jgi:hypothetical protein